MRRYVFVLVAVAMVSVTGNCFAQTPGTPRPAGRGPMPTSQSHEASVRLFNSWKPVMAPRRIIGNIYYVGLSGVSSWLIATPEGHILIDTTFPETAPQICSNVETLGFHVGDIKLILSSHAHADHTGGHEYVKRQSGGKIVASAADAHLLETGGADDFSPFPKDLLAYPPVKADQIVNDGETVTLGGITLTAHLTPGHTKGATTWTMPLKGGERVYNVVFFSSASIADPTPLLKNEKYPYIVEDFAATFQKLKELPCDIFLAPHADQFNFADKLRRLDAKAEPNPFIDPDGWHRLITNAENTYLRQLAAEKAAK